VVQQLVIKESRTDNLCDFNHKLLYHK